MSIDGPVAADVPEAAVKDFASRLKGMVVVPGDAEYESARRVWNAMIDRRPALIARCADATDVQRAVEFGRTHDLVVAVRGGGHSAAGFGTCDGGLVIDLFPMKAIEVDPDTRTARAGPGLILREFDQATQAFGLATTAGFLSTTGIAGLTLGGGLGYLMRRFGLACDNLLSAGVVTADGEKLTASAEENEDLFWGLRGGGGNFGVVTSFEYRLHEVGPTILAGIMAHPLPKAREVLRFYREFTASAPEELTVHAGLLTTPDGVPALGFQVCYSGPLEQGEDVVRPLREFGPPVMDAVQPMPYVAYQTMFDPLLPSGLHSYWKSNFMRELSDEAIEAWIELHGSPPSPMSGTFLEQMGGAVKRIPADATAFGDRSADYSLIILGLWQDPADSERNVQWARGLFDGMQPFTRDTVYVNYLGAEGEERVKASYSANYDRLVALKNKYDPTNFFRLNQNIKPTVS